MIETMPGGVAAFDYNGDGLTDIFFTNGASIPSLEKDSPKFFNRLYRNDGGMKFTDVTSDAGVSGAGYSMGAAAADYNNDGHTDLFVAGVYRNILYRNLSNGKFEDVTKEAGIKSDKWSVAAGWFDYRHSSAQHPSVLGVINERDANSVLDAATRIPHFQFGNDLTRQSPPHPCEFHHRRLAN